MTPKKSVFDSRQLLQYCVVWNMPLMSELICSYRSRRKFPANISMGVSMICDWCGKGTSSVKNKKNYHMLLSYANHPVVCKECYKQLRKKKKIGS